MQIRKLALLVFTAASCSLFAQQDSPSLQHRNATPAPMATTQLTIPTGTGLHLSLDEQVSSETAKINDGFSAKLLEPVVVNGNTVLAAGTVVHGRIKDVSNPGRRFHGITSLTLRPDTVILPDGHQVDISAVMTDSFDRKAFKLDSEGSISNSARHYTTMSAVGAGAGGIAGAFIAGPWGIARGAMIGAALPAARWATKNDVVELPAGSDYWFELSRPVNISRVN
ncbi:MAG: hypothetical protein JOZ43_05380 [Acidobacteriales bacterium]|nr:hypothetical protein [Terriglobales bacterium]